MGHYAWESEKGLNGSRGGLEQGALITEGQWMSKQQRR